MKSYEDFKTDLAWERYLKAYYMGLAMQSIVGNSTMYDGTIEGSCSEENHDFIASDAMNIAKALIKQLKQQ